MYPVVCLPSSIPSTGYHVTVSTPGLHGVCTLDTGGKGQKVREYGRLRMYLAVCPPFSVPLVGSPPLVDTEGCALGTRAKGRRLDNMVNYISSLRPLGPLHPRRSPSVYNGQTKRCRRTPEYSHHYLSRMKSICWCIDCKGSV